MFFVFTEEKTKGLWLILNVLFDMLALFLIIHAKVCEKFDVCLCFHKKKICMLPDVVLGCCRWLLEYYTLKSLIFCFLDMAHT